MSGHSKWAKIKRSKSANDAQKGKLFSKLIREVTIAAKESGPATQTNARLRLAIQNAKGANMPKETIERAIKKGSGSDSADYMEVTYEGYAPFGVGVFIECMTDNFNRTVSFIRSIFSKHGGSLGKNGSLEFIFNRQGVFRLPSSAINDEDAFTLAMIDAGAQDVEVERADFYVVCSVENFVHIQKQLEVMHIAPKSAELQRTPITHVALPDEALQKVMKLIDDLEDNDDVQRVYHNMAIREQQMVLLS